MNYVLFILVSSNDIRSYMPVFDKSCNVNSPLKTVVFFIILIAAIGIILGLIYWLFTAIGINPLYGVLLGSALIVGVLWFVLDLFNNKFFSPKNYYIIKKKENDE